MLRHGVLEKWNKKAFTYYINFGINQRKRTKNIWKQNQKTNTFTLAQSIHEYWMLTVNPYSLKRHCVTILMVKMKYGIRIFFFGYFTVIRHKIVIIKLWMPFRTCNLIQTFLFEIYTSSNRSSLNAICRYWPSFLAQPSAKLWVLFCAVP